MSGKKRKTNFLMQGGVRAMAVWPVWLIIYIKIIYMSYKNGMTGMSYYAYGVSVFILLYSLTGMAVVPVLRKLIYFQVNKGSYKNASRIYHSILAFNMLIVFLLSVMMFVFSKQLSVLLFGTVLCSLLFKILAVALICWVPAFCIRGYMEGLGNPMPGVVADIISQLTGLLFTCLTQPGFSSYGKKVAALVKVDDYTFAYSVCAGAVGIVASGLTALLFLSLIKLAFGKDLGSQIKNDEVHSTDKVTDIIWNYLSLYFSEMLEKQMGIFLSVLLMLFYSGNVGKTSMGAGMLYTGVFWLMIPLLIVSEQIGMPFSRQLTAIMKRLDYHHARERMAVYLKVLSYHALPYVVFIFCMAEPIASVFFDIQGEAFIKIIRIASVLSLITAYAVFFRYVSDGIMKALFRNLFVVIALAAGIVFYFIISKSGVLLEESYIYALMLAWLCYLLLECFVLLKKLRIYNRLVRCVVLPFAAAVCTGLVLFGVGILLNGKIADMLLIVIAAVLGYLLYNTLIVLLHVFDNHEWNEVPLKQCLVFLSGILAK